MGRDETHEMLVEARALLRSFVGIHEQATGPIAPNNNTILGAAKKCVAKKLPPERKS
jgi:hypothetical protein